MGLRRGSASGAARRPWAAPGPEDARAGINNATAVLGVFSPLTLSANLMVDHETSVPGASRSAARLAAGSGRGAFGPVSFSGNSPLAIEGASSGVNYANPPCPRGSCPRPFLNLKASPVLSDTYATTKVGYAGAHTDQDFESQVMDDITWGARAGVELHAGDFSVGLNYIYRPVRRAHGQSGPVRRRAAL